jgi:LuxR family maltose regulon positive regulatory protein
LDATSHNLEHGLTLADKLMVAWSWTRDGLITLARVRQLHGDFEGAQVLVERAIDMSHHMQDLFDRIDVSFWQARLWLAQNNLPAAARWATEYQADVESRIEAADMVLARVFMAQGETGQALNLLAPISEAAGGTGRKGAQIESLTLQALAYQEQGDLQQAQTSLVQALSLAEPEGYLRTFVDEGPPMKALLTKHLVSSGDNDSSRTYVIKLLGAFPEKTTRSFESSSAAILDPLTEREIQVLGLLAAGLKTPEIASELHLANSTVKWYLRNIYSKLDVHRRADAIARAYELDLL